MFHYFRPFAASLLLIGMAIAEENSPHVFSLSPGALKNRDRKGAAGPALTKLLAEASAALELKPLSVIDKPKPGPSGDKHDYFSTAPYYWPDPAKKDGLPYIRKDGQRNPESRNEYSDSPRLSRMAGSAET